MTSRTGPSLVLLAGPNGAGKTTCAKRLLRGALDVPEFVNADAIAQGLSGFQPSGVGIEAGRIMLERLGELARRRASFAFETTLASRSFAPWIVDLGKAGYRFHLVFLWLPSASLAVRRVAERARLGGHAVPPQVVVRRYHRGLENLFRLYMPLATTWHVYDNSRRAGPREIVRGGRARPILVTDAMRWERLKRTADQGRSPRTGRARA